jgi:hypothetical protein
MSAQSMPVHVAMPVNVTLDGEPAKDPHADPRIPPHGALPERLQEWRSLNKERTVTFDHDEPAFPDGTAYTA